MICSMAFVQNYKWDSAWIAVTGNGVLWTPPEWPTWDCVEREPVKSDAILSLKVFFPWWLFCCGDYRSHCQWFKIKITLEKIPARVGLNFSDWHTLLENKKLQVRTKWFVSGGGMRFQKIFTYFIHFRNVCIFTASLYYLRNYIM